MVDGQSAPAIREALGQIYPDAKPDAVIKRVAAEFAAFSHEPADAVRGWCMASARELFRQMKSVGDYTGALRAIQLIAKLADKAPEDAIDI